MKFHWPAVLSFLTTAIGVAASPMVLGIMPAKAAVVIAAAGSIVQAFTKPIPKPDAP